MCVRFFTCHFLFRLAVEFLCFVRIQINFIVFRALQNEHTLEKRFRYSFHLCVCVFLVRFDFWSHKLKCVLCIHTFGIVGVSATQRKKTTNGGRGNQMGIFRSEKKKNMKQNNFDFGVCFLSCLLGKLEMYMLGEKALPQAFSSAALARMRRTIKNRIVFAGDKRCIVYVLKLKFKNFTTYHFGQRNCYLSRRYEEKMCARKSQTVKRFHFESLRMFCSNKHN